jgi:hypothetical protein
MAKIIFPIIFLAACYLPLKAQKSTTVDISNSTEILSVSQQGNEQIRKLDSLFYNFLGEFYKNIKDNARIETKNKLKEIKLEKIVYVNKKTNEASEKKQEKNRIFKNIEKILPENINLSLITDNYFRNNKLFISLMKKEWNFNTIAKVNEGIYQNKFFYQNKIRDFDFDMGISLLSSIKDSKNQVRFFMNHSKENVYFAFGSGNMPFLHLNYKNKQGNKGIEAFLFDNLKDLSSFNISFIYRPNYSNENLKSKTKSFSFFDADYLTCKENCLWFGNATGKFSLNFKSTKINNNLINKISTSYNFNLKKVNCNLDLGVQNSDYIFNMSFNVNNFSANTNFVYSYGKVIPYISLWFSKDL